MQGVVTTGRTTSVHRLFYTSTVPHAQSVFLHNAFGVDVGEGRSFLHIRHHGRVIHPEPAVLSSSATTVGKYL